MHHIPNVFTLLNLIAGLIGIVAVPYNVLFASSMIFVAMFFDFLDGFFARLLRITSFFGRELDSLADIVSFSVLPALILLHIMAPDLYWSSLFELPLYVFILIIIPICAALRLARYNIDQSQHYHYKGLPVPANAMWIASVPFILKNYNDFSVMYYLFSSHLFLILFVVISSLLMVSKWYLLAIKFQNFHLVPNLTRYGFIALSLILVILKNIAAIPLIFLLYLVVSFVHVVIFKKNY